MLIKFRALLKTHFENLKRRFFFPKVQRTPSQGIPRTFGVGSSPLGLWAFEKIKRTKPENSTTAIIPLTGGGYFLQTSKKHP